MYPPSLHQKPILNRHHLGETMQIHGMSKDGRTITLTRFDGGVNVDPLRNDDNPKRLLVVDVETTGVDTQSDEMIEFAAALLLYTDDGRITNHFGTYSWLQDPGRPIPEVVTDITGITDKMVEGQAIPNEAGELIAGADLIVSHNAAFDWAFCRRRWPAAVDGRLWGCSLKQIDWAGLGFPAARQEILTRYHGFFYDAHRATTDVEALVRLLQMRAAPDQPNYLQQMIWYLDRPRYRIRANGTPFACKDDLKRRSYRWDPERRVWWTTCSADQLEEEKHWLNDLYDRYGSARRADIQKVDPRQQWA